MKTILYVNHSSKLSGAEMSLLDLLRRLDPKRCRPLVAVPEDGPLAGRLREIGITPHYVTMERIHRTWNILRLLRYGTSIRHGAHQLREIIVAEAVDIVHSNSTTAHIYTCWATSRTPVPTIWHVRDMVDLGLLGRWLARRSSRIIAISQAVLESAQPGCGMLDRWAVVHNGVDMDRFEGADGTEFRESIGAGPNDTVVGMIAQLVPWKRHADFLQAAQRLHSSLPDVKFVLVGDDLFGDHPDYKAQLLQMSEALRTEGVLHFAGHCDPIEPVIAAMDVVVLPSVGEPFGRVLIEAAAAGLPAIAVNDAGPREIIRNGETGMLVPPRDVDALAGAIESLCRDREKARRLGENARRHVAEHFTSAQTAGAIQAMYDDLLEPDGDAL